MLENKTEDQVTVTPTGLASRTAPPQSLSWDEKWERRPLVFNPASWGVSNYT